MTKASELDFGVDISAATEHARAMLVSLGVLCDPDTPARYVKALSEITAGRHLFPDRHLAKTFPAESSNHGLVLVPGIRFVSICEHHLLPFTGTAAVAYLPSPGARIVGLSKLARLVQEYAARPQVQERLGEQVVHAIGSSLDTRGAACLIRSVHTCMTLRGARAEGADMVTTHFTGRFAADTATRSEFLGLVGGTTGRS
ncbi:GTP cyclohydrolase I [Umezawaea sp. Da 62-37]|uniref:GTP cyclohydrolase I n=1 Tax=Umezawaea sp. Da 62-37 TaxID=3075927 RepID=UPI0028F6E87C|nr:GTP cyclohydrolase I [Umezawaea sp. Da 62-37]WNV88001.1 GTP cyclohydrolase I [Umezawaea sp. Da 62-37]